MCWETSEEGEMWTSLVLYMIVRIGSLLLSILSEIWGHALPFLFCPSGYFVFILFCTLNYQKLREERFLCCASAAFSDSSPVLCIYGSFPAPVCAQNLEAVCWCFPVALSSFVHLWNIVCAAVSGADRISGEGTRTCACIQSDWQGASFLEIP